MNKILKAIIYILILTFLYLWLSTVFDSCGNKSAELTEEREETENTLDEVLGDDDLVDLTSAEDREDEFEEEEEETSYEEIAAEQVEEISNDLTEPLEEETYTPPPTQTNTTYSAGNSSPFLIVAGSFSQEGNANTLVDKLRRMGYNDAEKVRFDESSFYSVVAERHTDYDRALKNAGNLKGRGVDCYVHKRK